MSDEIEKEKVSKKEINRHTNDKTYKPDVNIRAPKHEPYKRNKKTDYYEQAEEEQSQNCANDVGFFGRYDEDDLTL